MSANNNFLGVSYFGLGAPGDGIMGTTLTEFTDIEVGSVNIEGSQPNEQTISTESDDNYLTVNNNTTPTTVRVRLFGITAAQMVVLAGGEATGDVWSAPQSAPNIYLSMRMRGKEVNGKRGILEIPYGKIVARPQGTITKNGLPATDVTITANTPVSAAGDKGAPYSIGTEDVV